MSHRASRPFPASMKISRAFVAAIFLTASALLLDLFVFSGDPATAEPSEVSATVRPFALKPGANDVILNLGGTKGIWTYLNTTELIESNTGNADDIVIGDIDGDGMDDIIADFGFGTGLWARRNNGDWAPFNELETQHMATGDLDGNGKADVITDFGDELGTWVKMNDVAWMRLNVNATQGIVTGDLDGNGQDEVILNLGSIGTWAFVNNTTWQRQNVLAAAHMATGDLNGNGQDELILDLAPHGIWSKRDNGGFEKLNSAASEGLITGDIDGDGRDDLIADFGADFGLWVIRGDGVWQQINALSPSTARAIVAVDLDQNGRDDIVADFGPGFGVQAYSNDAAWTLLDPNSADILVAGDIDGSLTSSTANLSVQGSVGATGIPAGSQIIAESSSSLEISSVGEDGSFAFHDLPPGAYQIKSQIPGFVTPKSVGVVVNNNTAPIVDFQVTPLAPDVWTYHWEEDQSTAGREYSSVPVRPRVVNFLDQDIQVPDIAAADQLLHDFNVILSDAEEPWSQEHAYRLLETLKTVPQQVRDSRFGQIHPPSQWILTNDFLVDDITLSASDGGWAVRISSAVFTYATRKLVEVDGKRGRFFSKRLHHSLVRFVTRNGRNLAAIERILTERFGVSLRVPDFTALTALTTQETSARFQEFAPEELLDIISQFEEIPNGMHKISNLKFLVRRANGIPHPIHPAAPAVAWSSLDQGYIEFMERAFTSDVCCQYLHRLIIHEKAHFIWHALMSDKAKERWAKVGDWFEDENAPDGYSTKKTTEFVSAYAHAINPEEDFAESVSFFVLNPAKLRSRSPNKLAFIRDQVMQGSIFISQIRDDLTFEVLNLFPDYIFPGKIKRLDITASGGPLEDKEIFVEVELWARNKVLEGARRADFRVFSTIGTYFDITLYPVDKDGETVRFGDIGTILNGSFTLSSTAKAGFWRPDQIRLEDRAGLERLEGINDFGWKLFIDNANDDTIPPRYVRDSMTLALTTNTTSFERAVQIITAEWLIDENLRMNDRDPCRAVINNKDSLAGSLHAFATFDETTRKCAGNFIVTEFFATGAYTMALIRMKDEALNDSIFRFSDDPDDEPGQAISVITSNPDSLAPELNVNDIKIRARPTRPDAPNGETLVTLEYRVRDDKSGLGRVTFTLRDPSGGDHFNWHYHENFYTIFFDGDATNWRKYKANALLPEGSIPGIWGLSVLYLEDKALNGKNFDFTETIQFEVDMEK